MNNLPFRTVRGKPPVVRHDAPERERPHQVNEAGVKVLDLSEAKDLRTLQDIMELYGQGALYLHSFEKQFVPEKQNWMVFVSYFKLYREMPDETAQRQRAFLNGGSCI